MKRKVINDNGRQKAFIGAAIGAVTNLVGGIIGKRKQKKAQERAYRQAQEEQTNQEGVQQAAAMSAQYANQDYVDQYRNKITLKNGGKVNMKTKGNDRIAVAKKFKCGGRRKAGLGSEISNDFKTIGQNFNKANIGNTIVDGINAAANVINGTPTVTVKRAGNLQSVANTSEYINAAKDAARDAEVKKQQRTSAAKYGTRRKAMAGLGEAIGGVTNMISSLTQSTKPQKQVQKSNGFSYDAPKTGIEQNSYQTDENGNPVNATNTVNGNNTNSVNTFEDENTKQLKQAKLGTIRKVKRVK